jgi:hypothetical protein
MASGKKARRTHEMSHLPLFKKLGKRGRQGIFSSVRLAFSPQATYGNEDVVKKKWNFIVRRNSCLLQ